MGSDQLTEISLRDDDPGNYEIAVRQNANGEKSAQIQSAQHRGTHELLKAFENEIEEIRRAIEKTEENVNEIDAKHKQSLRAGLTSAKNNRLNSEISTLVAQSTTTSQAVREKLGRDCGGEC